MNLIEITKGYEPKQNEQTEQMKSLPDTTDKWKQLAKEIQKLKKRVELQLEKISEIKLFCGIGYVASVIFAVCLIEICIL